jgi:hypothetical protein
MNVALQTGMSEMVVDSRPLKANVSLEGPQALRFGQTGR